MRTVLNSKLLPAVLIIYLLPSNVAPIIWYKSDSSYSGLAIIKSSLADSHVSCLFSVGAELTDAQLVAFSSDTGVCNAYKCSFHPEKCRRCHNSQLNSQNQQMWVRDLNSSCWITVQHRVSDSVSFNRNWSEYRSGFGDGPNANFWIGLESLYSLTNTTPRYLLIMMRLWNDTWSWAQYTSFSIGPESDKYRLHVSGFSGSSGVDDSFTGYWQTTINNGEQFTTYDQDNDRLNIRNCANTWNGGWWFNACFSVHLNGRYLIPPVALNSNSAGIIWVKPFGYDYSLQEVEMLVN